MWRVRVMFIPLGYTTVSDTNLLEESARMAILGLRAKFEFLDRI